MKAIKIFLSLLFFSPCLSKIIKFSTTDSVIFVYDDTNEPMSLNIINGITVTLTETDEQIQRIINGGSVITDLLGEDKMDQAEPIPLDFDSHTFSLVFEPEKNLITDIKSGNPQIKTDITVESTLEVIRAYHYLRAPLTDKIAKALADFVIKNIGNFETLLNPEYIKKVRETVFSNQAACELVFSAYKKAAIALAWHPLSLDTKNKFKLVTFSQDGKLCAVAPLDENNVSIWHMTTPTPLFEGKTRPEGPVQSVKFSKNGLYFAIKQANNTANIWKIDTRTPKISLANVHEISLSPDNTHVAVIWRNGRASMYNIETRELIFTVNPPLHEIDDELLQLYVKNIKFSPDGSRVAFNCGALNDPNTFCVIIRNTSNGNQILVYEEQVPTKAVAFSNDNTLVKLQISDNYIIIDTEADGERKKLLNEESDEQLLSNVAFSPSNKYMAAALPNEVYLLEKIENQENEITRWTFDTSGGAGAEYDEVEKLVFSPKENYLLTLTRNGHVYLHNVETGHTSKLIKVNNEGAKSASIHFCQDEKFILISENDSNTQTYHIHIFDTDSGQQIKTLSDIGILQKAYFAVNGRYIIAHTKERIYEQGETHTQDITRILCQPFITEEQQEQVLQKLIILRLLHHPIDPHNEKTQQLMPLFSKIDPEIRTAIITGNY